jgi:serine/threonine protein phosphatase 1
VFPDLHGCIDTFRYTFEEVICPDESDEIYFIGDFINKGPDSKGVLDYVFHLIESGYKIRAVRGNHEQLLLNAINDKTTVEDFIIKGGLETLESFKVSTVDEIPDHYIEFINKLPFYIELEDFIVVHAGFNYSASDPFSDSYSMLHTRDFVVDPEKTRYKTIIHGHYATPLQEILHNVMEKRNYKLNIDNGCVYTHREGMGNLFVLNLSDLSYIIQPCLDEHDYEHSVSKRRYYKNRG